MPVKVYMSKIDTTVVCSREAADLLCIDEDNFVVPWLFLRNLERPTYEVVIGASGKPAAICHDGIGDQLELFRQ
jgi:hypothetical protein